jgi:acetyltransferase-like isoleucine patch superfamily enzyme
MFPHIINRVFHKLAYFLPGGYTIRPKLHRMRGAHIGKNVWISQYVYIDELHPEAVSIGDNSTIGLRTSIFSHFYWGPRRSTNGFKKVVIEKNVFIGPHCLILPGVRVGEGAVVKGGSVLTANVPANTLWGPPASQPLGRATVPLTPETSYNEFVRGLRPYRKINN